jgi:hypothetical protein
MPFAPLLGKVPPMIRFLPRYSFAVLLAILAAPAFPAVALADVPPPDECPTPDMAGQPCTTAGPNFNQDGVCTNATCHSPSPPPDGSSYACLLCTLTDAGPPMPEAGPPPDSGPSTPDAGPPADASPANEDASPEQRLSSSSSCAVGPAGPGTPEGPWALGLAALGLGALGLAAGARLRRRRS